MTTDLLSRVPAEGEALSPRFYGPDYAVDSETGCWNWLKGINVDRGGYPYNRPHRKYWEAANGPIPVGHDVHHICYRCELSRDEIAETAGHLEVLADALATPGSGSYSVPRQCGHCGFETLDRDEYWAHRAAHETEES